MNRLWVIWFFSVFTQSVISLHYNPLPKPEDEWIAFNDILNDVDYRLPTTTTPNHYDVNLTPYFDDPDDSNLHFTFDGDVQINIVAVEANVQEIVMHCNDLQIKTVSVQSGETELFDDTIPQCEVDTSFLRIRTNQVLQINQEYVVQISFSGNLQEGMRGFYRSWYDDNDGRKWMATTQFQPGHARQAFPCYDEPLFKATFDITINREQDFSPTISNMPIRTTNLINGRIADTFYTTPKMSTYLLAFIVSHYDVVSNTNDTSRPFEIYARKNVGSTGDWSLDIGERLLSDLEEYTAIPYYTMQNNMIMQQAAIPDFSAGAMENWGLLTYREALILYDPDNSNNNYKRRIANIVAHEVAHMWFGNLVTCAWWDNLWLNEAFARFYQYYSTHSVEPEFGNDIHFIVEQVHTALFADSVDNAHALTDPTVGDPNSVSAHFSTITYNRGAAVLRMTQYLLGKSTYEKGLRYYLDTRKFEVAEPQDLFDALDRAAVEDNALVAYNGLTIDTYFKTWSENAGHPLLTVVINQETGSMTVSQARWERNTGQSTESGLWDVPITWTRGGNPDFEDLKPSQVLRSAVSTINRGSLGLEWVVFNKQQSGFYRVNYDDTNWDLLTLALRSDNRTVIHEMNAAQIVDDLFALARAGVKSYTKTFNILSFLEFEDRYAPWMAAISGYNFLRRRLAHDEDNLNKLQDLIITQSKSITERLGYTESNDNFMDNLLRMNVMVFLCNIGHEECISNGVQMFTAFRESGARIPPNLRPWVYCVGLRHGTAADFDALWERYMNEDLANEKIVLLEALGCTRNVNSLEKYLEETVSGIYSVRPQDYNTAINSAISGNEENTQIVFNWLKDELNMEKAKTALGSVSSLISSISARLLTPGQILEFEEWLENVRDDIGSAYDTGVAGVAAARNNLIWSDSRLDEMAYFFENGYQEVEVEEPNVNYRLPTTTYPSHYEVSITPYFENSSTNVSPFTFEGEVIITIAPSQPEVQEIVMHCNDLVITSISVESTSGGSQLFSDPIPQCEINTSFLRIRTNQVLQINQEYTVTMEFSGNLQENMRGFYKSWYDDSEGRKWMGTTQFQPGHARQAFPCYDEPLFKATFDITINREQNFSPTISNMPISTTNVLDDGRIAERFYTTPKMSTYLLAFIISHYDVVSNTDNTDRPFKIYARENAGSTGDWSLDIGERLLSALEEYTAIPYYTMQNNMTMQQAAIPDFSAGAMENWGLLTYREALILFDPNNSNNHYKRRIANIVAHEVAHMWFGNLVTCAWWDNLWLNEAFARFYEYFSTHSVQPDLGNDIHFIVEQVHTAMVADSVDTAHALTNPSVGNPASVSAHFSTITYARGAVVLRMTQYFLGQSTYEKGLRQYLYNRKFDVAEPQDLFDALDAAAVEDNALSAYNDITISDYFKTWSEKAGHPLLTIVINQSTGSMTVTQERWEQNTGQSTQPGLWDVPITWTGGNNPDFNNLKPSNVLREHVVELNRGTIGLEWVIFNIQQSGLYRVNYDDTNWDLLTLALRGTDRTVIHEMNAAQIVDDLFALARAGVKSYTRAFNILSFLEFEDRYAPWMAAISGYNFLRRRLAHDQENLNQLQDLIITQSKSITERLGYTESNDNFMDNLLRMNVMVFLCSIGHEECISNGVQMFTAFRESGAPIPPNLRPWVYCVGLRHGTAADFDALWERYMNEDLANEKIVLLEALGCTSNINSLEKYLEETVSGIYSVRPQDHNTVINSVISGNEENSQIVFNWLQNENNMNNAINAFGGLSGLITSISARLLTTTQIEEFEQWLENVRDNIGSAYNTGIQGVATARSNLDWSNSRLDEMAYFFENGYQEVEVEEPNVNYRLPTTTHPSHYQVSITPYFENSPTNISPFTFEGEVIITIAPSQPEVQEIVMHCNDLVITSISVESTSGGSQLFSDPIPQCEINTSFLRIRTNQVLQMNQEYTVTMEFSGNLQENMRGFYRSWYDDSEGRKWMGTTQFQPGHARQAFPCYDEPLFKATFDVTINRESDFSPSLSNMPIRSTTEVGDRIAETFYTTPKMSTYLLAFIVSHYEVIANTNDDSRPFAIYARENARSTGEWSLEIGERLLLAMENYTQIPYYTMQNNMIMQQAAIPDFSANAMENWGLLTYREALILFDPENTNNFYKQRIANIVSHEIVHMWFGNLVTCAWWDNLWLNEGFARFYQYFLTHRVVPELGFDIRFIVEQVHTVMFDDSVDSAHALTDPSVSDPASVSAHFSAITYARGASVLRMTQYLLGTSTYEKGLREYLDRRQFLVAEPQDLFDALDAAAVEDNALSAYDDITISTYFKTWSEKAGHPLLSVVINQETGFMTVTQARWERNTGQSAEPGLWDVPITWTRGGNPNFEDLKPSQILRNEVSTLSRGSLGLEWVIFNIQQTGFYRVNYDDTNWDLLTLALRGDDRTIIHEINAAQIVDDLFALARAGVKSYTKTFNILSFLEFEDRYAPWMAAISGYNFLRRRLAHDEDNLNKLQDLIITQSKSITERLGYTESNDNFMDNLLRMNVMVFLCNIGHEECISNGVQRFTAFRDNGAYIPPNLRPWVYCVGLRQGNSDDFDFIWDRYVNEDLPNEKIVLLEALGCTRDANSLEKYLDEIVSGIFTVRSQDHNTAINSIISGNEENSQIVFNWVKNENNMNNAITTFGDLSSLITSISARLLTLEQIEEFEQWLENVRDNIGSAYNTGIQGVATARSNIDWSNSRLDEMENYFDNGYQEVETPAIYRLPTTTYPSLYQVTLTPYFENSPTNISPFTFEGEVIITIAPSQPEVQEIVMHCNDLVITSISVVSTSGGSQLFSDPIPQCQILNSFLRIRTNQVLEINQEYIVTMEFSGNLQESMRGFYRSWYDDSEGRKWMGTTQFQPGHARQAFPCYDEPLFKATFDITINRESDFSPSLSNMPISSTTEVGDRIAETFYRTPRMSTYLLAFIVSHYEVIANTNDDSRPFAIYARENARSTGEWSLEIGEKLLLAMESYTQIPYYTMQNNMIMQQAAIPDFSAGAMENWGLLTYREALILFDPENTNNFYKQRIANIVSHEIAHMWFGNLVTCAWWDNLWLNEGFARFYQYYLTHRVDPDLGFDIRFIVEQVHTAMFSDSVDSAHALTNPSVSDPASVSAHFSTITYARGAAVLRMTQHLLGDATYEKGLRLYLDSRQFDVVEPQDLFDALDAAAVEDNALVAYNGLTISKYFKTWSEKAGHPLLTVVTNSETGVMIITQERWERTKGQSEQPSLWDVPVTWTRGGAPDFNDLKPSSILSCQISLLDRGSTGFEWVIFNKQQTGFYRINYDDTNWGLLTLALRGNDRTVIHELNAAQIVDDLFALARAGVKSYTRAFNILSFLEFEDRYAPWMAAISGYNFLRRRLAHDQENLNQLQDIIITQSTSITGRLGYTESNDHFMDNLLRMNVMVFLCNIGHEQCISNGVQMFTAFRESGARIPPNLRPWVYCTGLRNGNSDDFDALWEHYMNEDLANEKIVLLEALGCTRDANSLEKYMDEIVSGIFSVRSQDHITAINSAINGNEDNTQIVYNWLKNEDNMNKAIALGSLSTMLSSISARLLTPVQINEFEQWLETVRDDIGSAYNTGVAGVATARSNLEWSNSRIDEMVEYFENGYQDFDPEAEPEPEPEPEPPVTDLPTTTEDSANVGKLGIVTLLIAIIVNVIHF